MTNEESTVIVSFMTPGTGREVLCQGVAIKVVKRKCIISSKAIFSTLGDGSNIYKKTDLMICLLIPIELTGYKAAFLCHC